MHYSFKCLLTSTLDVFIDCCELLLLFDEFNEFDVFGGFLSNTFFFDTVSVFALDCDT